MSICSNHRKDVHGETDMKHLAEEIGNLHYETLSAFLFHLQTKLHEDSMKDLLAERFKLGHALQRASGHLFEASMNIEGAWNICKPFMSNSEQNPERSVATESQSGNRCSQNNNVQET